MARIRSIHPNTPTDPELASVPVEARLLFIYSWTMADDAGNLEGNPRGLRMALFPGDDWATVARITELVDVLIAGRFFEPYEADGKQYLHVRNFLKYQKLDHPTAPKVPLAPGQEYTFHVRQGNTFVPRKENGPPLIPRTAPEQHTNSTRTAHERSDGVRVPFSQEGNGSGLEGKGKEVDWTGKEGRGTGREGKHDKKKTHAEGPLPLEGGGASSPSIKGNGEDTARASRKKGGRFDTERIKELASHISDEYLRGKVEEAYDSLSWGRMPVADGIELLDKVPMEVQLREELSHRFRAVKQAAN